MKGMILLSNGKTKIRRNLNIYQKRNGAICMLAGNQFIDLTKEQAGKLHSEINFYEMLKDFDLEDYKKYYGEELSTTPV